VKSSKPSSEATIISFKVLVNSKGVVLTEISGIPDDGIASIFKGADRQTLQSIVRLMKSRLLPLHDLLEEELDSLNRQ